MVDRVRSKRYRTRLHRTQTALKRTGAIIITRLMTYGAYWKKWSAQRVWTSKGHLTALTLREQKVFSMNNIGEYEIHEKILQLARDTNTN